jgi:hypothetical protein
VELADQMEQHLKQPVELHQPGTKLRARLHRPGLGELGNPGSDYVRTTFFDSFRSRQIVLIPLPSVKCSRLIFAPRRWARTNGTFNGSISKISIPCSAFDNHRSHNGPNPRSVASLLDADHPRSGVLIASRSTHVPFL